jgi:membrane-associated phospholipid phosphatase
MSKTIYVPGKIFPNFMKRTSALSLLLIIWVHGFGQQSPETFVFSGAKPVKTEVAPVAPLRLTAAPDTGHHKVYKVKYLIDVPLAVAGIAGTLYGFAKIGNKDKPDSNVVKNLPNTVNSINKLDRKVAGNFSEGADATSDIAFYGAYPFPIVLLFDKAIRKDALNVYLIYVETMGLVGSGYSNTAGHVNKFRPYAYGTKAPFDKRWNKNAQNSFYGGHPSAVAGATFFAAKVYSDYHPESKLKYVFYGVAGGATLYTAYLRARGGNHFITDLAIGCTVGTTLGILVPHLHKIKKDKGMSVLPFTGQYHGLTMNYKW